MFTQSFADSIKEQISNGELSEEQLQQIARCMWELSSIDLALMAVYAPDSSINIYIILFTKPFHIVKLKLFDGFSRLFYYLQFMVRCSMWIPTNYDTLPHLLYRPH